jgi:hypothetical protein
MDEKRMGNKPGTNSIILMFHRSSSVDVHELYTFFMSLQHAVGIPVPILFLGLYTVDDELM